MKKKLWFCFVLFAAVVGMAAELKMDAVNLPNLGDWTLQPDRIFSEKRGAMAENEFQWGAEEEVNVWIGVFTVAGDGTRRTQVYVNDEKIGEFGDESGFSKANLHWMKAPAKVKLAQGGNKLKLVSLAYARFGSILFTTDDAFDPNKAPGKVPALGDDAQEFTFEKDLLSLQDIGTWTKAGNVLIGTGWSDGKEKGKGTYKAELRKRIAVSMEFESPADQMGVVWMYVSSRGEKWRVVNAAVNGWEAGKVGDGKLQDGVKAGGMQWEKCPVPVRLQKGKNVLEVFAASSMGRVQKVLITNDPDFEP